MKKFEEMFQKADWKSEKHVPVIEIPEKIKKEENIKITVSVGKEIPHPNTTEHHIAWIDIYFYPDGEKFPFHIGKFEFAAHGASTEGSNRSSIYTHPKVTFTIKTGKSGTILASSYCNIHGLWVNSTEIKLD